MATVTISGNVPFKAAASKCMSVSTSFPRKPLRYAVLGAGFAGISVAWHLLQHCSKTFPMCVEIYDETGIGGGASGVSGGLLHPYSPKGKLLWNGRECWVEAVKLLRVAEAMVSSDLPRGEFNSVDEPWIIEEPIVWRRGILRTALNAKHADQMKKSAQGSLPDCKLFCLNGIATKKIFPRMILPSDFALYMPQGVNIHPERYLKALFIACERKARELSAAGCSGTKVSLNKKNIISLLDFSGDHDAVIVCLGAKASLLPELAGKLPLSNCRGVVAHLELSSTNREIYRDEAPSILSSVWVAAQGPHRILIGATKEWGSSNTSSDVSIEETSSALTELLPKAYALYPPIKSWTVLGSRAGVRAMPARTSLGALPIIGSIDQFVLEYMQKDKQFEKQHSCFSHQKTIPRYWFVGGLGSRGLIYHGWLGKLIAKAVTSHNQDVLPSELTSWLFSN